MWVFKIALLPVCVDNISPLVALISPATSSLSAGDVVPMPTLPEESIFNASLESTRNVKELPVTNLKPLLLFLLIIHVSLILLNQLDLAIAHQMVNML